MKSTEDLYSPEKLVGSIKEAAKVSDTGVNQMYEAAHRGEIPVIRMGKRIKVKWQPFLRMLRD